MRVVIVGAGPAGHRVAERLSTRAGPETRVTLLGEEPELPYNRVLLSEVVAGRLDGARIGLPALPESVRVMRGDPVVSLDRAARTVRTRSGELVPYDRLVLALGARSAMPPVPGLVDEEGATAKRVVPLRTLADCRRLAEWLPQGGRAVVLGGGVLGLEAAGALAERGAGVDLVHPGPHPMDRQLGAEPGAALVSLLADRGVRCLLGRSARRWTGDRLVLDDDTHLPADVLVVTAGAVPQTALAAEAGLPVARGVIVDRRQRTADPNVFAVGDCAEVDGEVSGLLEPAWAQAETVAAVLAGVDTEYRAPSVLTRLKLRGVELAVLGAGDAATPGTQAVVLSDPARRRFARLSVRGDLIGGAVLLGFPDAVGPVVRIFDAGGPLPVDRLALLAGRAEAPGADIAAAPASEVVCRCHHVTKGALTEAWRAGARDRAALGRVTQAGTGCGGCGPVLERLGALLAGASE
ncbi:FAD-dependent oxidoreductase [Streptomyces venezuelae]|uniref:FAD-dependent oxidoreductase n=1 Tax=Streptomyces venezuelae TaxID=54571 RepID=UPI00331B7ED9